MKRLTHEQKIKINSESYFGYLGSNEAQICGCGSYSFGGGDPCGCGAGWDNATWTIEGYKLSVRDTEN